MDFLDLPLDIIKYIFNNLSQNDKIKIKCLNKYFNKYLHLYKIKNNNREITFDMLKCHNQLKSLHFNTYIDEIIPDCLISLTKLTLHNCSRLNNIGLKNLTNLKSLTIYDDTIDDTFIEPLTSLTYLDVSGTYITNKSLTKLVNLEKIIPNKNIDAKSLNILPKLKCIEFLMDYVNDDYDTNFNILNLKSLVLSCNHHGWEILEKECIYETLKKIKFHPFKQGISGMPYDNDIINLKNLTHLESRVSHFTPDIIKSLIHLKYIHIGSYKMLRRDWINVVPHLINLEILEIGDDSLCDYVRKYITGFSSIMTHKYDGKMCNCVINYLPIWMIDMNDILMASHSLKKCDLFFYW
jgi:hypothetical protein